MKTPLAMTAIVIASVVGGLASPAALARQEQERIKKHHVYRLVDLGTLGASASGVNLGGGPFFPSSNILNRQGTVAAVDCPSCEIFRAFSATGRAPRDLG